MCCVFWAIAAAGFWPHNASLGQSTAGVAAFSQWRLKLLSEEGVLAVSDFVPCSPDRPCSRGFLISMRLVWGLSFAGDVRDYCLPRRAELLRLLKT